jgi:hypothetical protein
MRRELYIREKDRSVLAGNGPVHLWMPKGLKCAAPHAAHARELANGAVVCMACQHGPCALPDGIEHDRELHVHKEPK